MSRILVVVSEVGYTWDEVFLPCREFLNAGHEVVIATPTGKPPRVDPLSVEPRSVLSRIGIGTDPATGPGSPQGKAVEALLAHPVNLASIKSEEWDALLVAGGHGSLFDLNKNERLHELILQFWKQKKPVGLICHAVSTLAFIKQNGRPFLEGKKVTGFPTVWEYLVLLTGRIYKDFLPFPIWTGKELNRAPSRRPLWLQVREVLDPGFVVADGRLVTGVGPKAGGALARRMLALL